MKLAATFYAEPLLQFGRGEVDSPKVGLRLGGPYSLRLGTAHPGRIKVGFVGPAEAIDGASYFLDRCQSAIPSGSNNPDLHPDYPGFGEAFRCKLASDPRWNIEMQDGRVSDVLAKPANEAFEACVDLWGDAIRTLSERDVRPDVVICCLPRGLVEHCGKVESQLSREQKRWLQKRERERQGRQLTFFDLIDAATVEAASQPLPEDLLFRDFRRTLKIIAMAARIPIQIATPSLWGVTQRGQQDPATRAWNLSVALFYKAGGIPWRVPSDLDSTCFVGISFHHLRTTQRDIVYASLAQAFSSEGDGFALRGEAAPRTRDDRVPHLTASQADALMSRVLAAYRDRTGRDPVRIVVHKTSNYDGAEADGILTALRGVAQVDLVTLRSGDFRVLRQGTYPPHRGSLFELGEAAFLFTTGFMPRHKTYPGPHVPVPIEVTSYRPIDVDQTARDLMALTKMNWNSAASFSAMPITVGFARRVGAVMAEVPSDQEPHPSFRYYM